MISPETQIEGIHIERLLARGGLSEVWLGRWQDSTVALKAFHRDKDWSDAEARECQAYFENEAQWLAKLHHPALAGYLRTLNQPLPAILLEYIPGVNLREWLDANRSAPPLDLFFHLASGVAQATQYLHSQGLMHRDLAPRNIMVTPDRETRLLDLQFVREVPAALEPLRRSMTNEIGDWAFAAPELMDQRDERYDERVDIYSLGAVLIEVLVGRPPRRRPPIQCRADVPPSLSAMLWAMVDEAPGNRPSWGEISPALNLP